MDKWMQLLYEVIWWGLLLIVSPYWLSHLKGAQSKGSASKSQTLMEDGSNFWGTAIVVINMWAYKVSNLI